MRFFQTSGGTLAAGFLVAALIGSVHAQQPLSGTPSSNRAGGEGRYDAEDSRRWRGMLHGANAGHAPPDYVGHDATAGRVYTDYYGVIGPDVAGYPESVLRSRAAEPRYGTGARFANPNFGRQEGGRQTFGMSRYGTYGDSRFSQSPQPWRDQRLESFGRSDYGYDDGDVRISRETISGTRGTPRDLGTAGTSRQYVGPGISGTMERFDRGSSAYSSYGPPSYGTAPYASSGRYNYNDDASNYDRYTPRNPGVAVRDPYRTNAYGSVSAGYRGTDNSSAPGTRARSPVLNAWEQDRNGYSYPYPSPYSYQRVWPTPSASPR